MTQKNPRPSRSIALTVSLLAGLSLANLSLGTVAFADQPPAKSAGDVKNTTDMLLAGQLSPQELDFTQETITQLLPMHDEADPGDRIRATVEEALETVASMIKQPNNKALVKWLKSADMQVKTDADLEAFMAQLRAVNKQYAAVVANVVKEKSGH